MLSSKKYKYRQRTIIAVGLSFLMGISFLVMNYNQIGLSVLAWAKHISGNGVDLSSIGKDNMPLIEHALWDQELKKYVSGNGLVNYALWKNNQSKLIEYTNLLSDNPPGSNWSLEEQLAYWINAYNAFTVKLILDHYPLESIKQISSGLPMIGSPWDLKFFEIGGIAFDLNTIEHEILRKRDEPRIHFAINCASFSCPVLRGEAYSAEQLDDQLEHQAYLFINDTAKNDINHNETQVSKIFDWFSADFGGLVGVTVLLKKHHTLYNQENNIHYVDYDWTLNENIKKQ